MKKFTSLILILICSCNTSIEPPEEISLKQFWIVEHGTFGTANLEVRQDTIYATGFPYLYAVSTEKGEVYWNSIIDTEQRMLSKKIFIRNSQIVINQLKVLKAYNQQDGEELWELDGKEDIGFRENGEHSYTPKGYIFSTYKKSVAAVSFSGTVEFVQRIDSLYDVHGVHYEDEVLYINGKYTVHGGLTKGMILAKDFATGKEVWRYDTENGGFYEQPIIEEEIIYSASKGNSPKKEVVALNKNSGQLLWRTLIDIGAEKVIVTPDNILINIGSKLQAFSKLNGSKQWEFSWESSASLFQPVYLSGFVYMSNYYQLFILDAETGELVHTEPVPKGGNKFWHLAVSKDKLFAQTSSQLIAYEPWHLRE